MANNPNLALLSSNLQTKVLENRNELFEFLTLGLMETLTNTGARVFEDIKGKLVLPNIDSVSMVQSGGTIAWNPTDDAIKFADRQLEVDAWKVDLVIDPFKWHNTYLAAYANKYANKGLQEIPFYEYLPKQVMKQIGADLRQLAWYGDKTLTSNTLLKVTNGWLKILKVDVAANNVEAITLGAITQANVVSQLDKFGRSIGVEYRNSNLKLICPAEIIDWYITASDLNVGRHFGFNELGNGTNNPGRPTIFLRGTNIQLVEEALLLPDGNGKHPLILVVEGNLAIGTNFLDEMAKIDIQQEKRQFNLMVDGKIGFNYNQASKTHKLMIVNEYFL